MSDVNGYVKISLLDMNRLYNIHVYVNKSAF